MAAIETMATELLEPRLAPHVGDLLGRLRWRIRSYIVGQGLFATLATLAAGFWVALGIDYLTEPPAWVRGGLTGLVLLTTLVVFYRLFLVRLGVPLPDASLAVLLERRYGTFGEGLLTAIEFSGRDELVSDETRAMLAHTCDSASRTADGLALGPLFNGRPLRRTVFAGGVLLASIALWGNWAPAAFEQGISRLLTLSNEPWPRATRLVIEGFENGEAVVARGGDLRVVCKAALDGVVPPSIEIRYRTADGLRDRKRMIREGNAEAEDQYQPFTHHFQGILSPVEFDVRGGDARISGLKIRVVDSPTMSSRLRIEYPEYMASEPREVPVTAAMPVPRGSRVTLLAEANKPLVKITVDYQNAAGVNQSASLDPDPADPRRFEYPLEPLLADLLLQFTLDDRDGIRNREPLRVSLVAVPDTAPQVNVRPQGIGSAITARARIPWQGEVVDDHGLATLYLEHHVDDDAPAQHAWRLAVDRSTRAAVEEVFDVEPMKLNPGQKMLIGVRATDHFNLQAGDQPNLGQGERVLLEIVTPEALRTMLEARELSLRQRFEQILTELNESVESLARLEATLAGDPQAPESENTPERRLERGRLRLARIRQNTVKNGGETEGVALSFEEIVAELVNNRIDTEELKSRLQQSIADPLHLIAQQQYPAVDKKLAALEGGLDGEIEARRPLLEGAQDELAALVVAMEQVKQKMLELETFNEALDLLREIIAEQQRVSEETKKQNKGNLLKDL